MPRSAIRCLCWKGNSAGTNKAEMSDIFILTRNTMPNVVVKWPIVGKPENLIWMGFSAFWLYIVTQLSRWYPNRF